MSENTKKTQITINDVSYNFEDLTVEQQTLFNHCVDLDRKIDQMRFNLDQLGVGKEAFISRLKAALEAPKE